MTQAKTPIAVAEGDGIGPEIMSATLNILESAGALLDIHKVEIGEKVYLRGIMTGIEPKTWDTIRETEAFLKAPITTPQGGGFRSLNVAVRTTLGLYANVRPCVAYHPYVRTKHPGMDVVIIRENEEDLYAGIEYRHTPDTVHALKVITRPGCEKIIRYAFEYARANERKKVTCFTKDNILKLSDGLFHQVFDEIAKEYPDIENEHWIIDIGAAKLADTPTAFDVVVMPNLYGDILSDVAAQIAGSVGLAGSANIGNNGAMFEAIHGSAPRRAGQNLANPSGLLLAGVQMLAHIGQPDTATAIHNAWLKTLEDGIHTYDIFQEGVSAEKVGTQEFGKAVIDRLGQKPEVLQPVRYRTPDLSKAKKLELTPNNKEKTTLGVDIFVDEESSVEGLRKKLSAYNTDTLELSKIMNRGVKVWPDTMPETFCSDSWRCRFTATEKGREVSHAEIAKLLTRLAEGSVDFTQTENLCAFGGQPFYSQAEG